MNCEKHADRPGSLAVDLPSIGVQRHLCDECRTALVSTLSQYKGKREAWDHSGYDYHTIGDTLYTRTSEGWRTTDPEQPGGIWK